MQTLFALLIAFAAQAAAYTFPYADPYYATMTAAILKADDRDAGVKGEDFPVLLRPERSSVPYFETRNFTHLRVWPQKHGRPAPLMVLVAGLGGSSGASYLNFLAWQFHKQGYHVLSVPSAFHWTFALAASDSGYPGVSRDDARDLYAVMQLGLSEIKKRRLTFTSVNLIGASMGALESAYVAALDKTENKIGFRKVLLINPPVDVLYGMSKLDELYAEGANIGADQLREVEARVFQFGFNALMERDIKSADYFYNIEERLPLNRTERRFVIGNGLREFLESLLFTTQQIDDRGIFKNPRSDWNPGPRMKEAAKFSFMEYINLFLLPALSEKRGEKLALEDLIPDTYLSGIENELRADTRVSVMHNEDDFIVRASDLDYLRSVFGTRLKLYPRGGHVGNIWYPENLKAILATFN